jgi:hypothetical protein
LTFVGVKRIFNSRAEFGARNHKGPTMTPEREHKIKELENGEIYRGDATITDDEAPKAA